MQKTIVRYTLVMLLALFSAACGAREPAQTSDAGVDSTAAVVYFTSRVTPQAVLDIYARLEGVLQGRIGIKVHFGEEGNQNYLPATLVKDLCLKLDGTLVETNTLYGGQRSKSESHIALARRHGFDYAPIDILDSEGVLAFDVPTKHFSRVYTGSHFSRYDSYLIFSHFKGHGSAGFGGAIKNVSMGFASPEGKRFLHQGNYPVYDGGKCIQCNICVRECPESAITIDPVVIDHTKCIACGKCIAVCPQKVFNRPEESSKNIAFLERLVEYAQVLSTQRKMLYINVLANISSGCDCFSRAPKPFLPDIGIVASSDIVAVEAASHDLVDKAHNCNDAFLKEISVSGKHQIEYAHTLGMGNRHYRLVDIDK